MHKAKGIVGVTALAVATISFLAPFGRADEGPEPKVVTGETTCRPTDVNQIPLAYLGPPLADPNPVWRVSQVYNTTVNDPKYAIGHNGLDLGGSTTGGAYDPEKGVDQRKPGIDKIYATTNGKVIVSNKSTAGWGNSVVIAARPSLHSTEIITAHYHHLHERYVEACSTVSRGHLLGLEGMTGNPHYIPHLHLTVRHWANLAHLQAWMDGGLKYLYGGDAYFEDESDFRGKPSPGAPNDSAGPFALFGYLDPEPLVKDYFIDITDTEYTWARTYAKKMRYYGIDFGLWNGEFGAGSPATRREAARWIRVALGSEIAGSSTVTQFSDVPIADPDYRYIHDLTTFPYIPVINPDRICAGNSISFCPDDSLNRAEALKMVSLAFYPDEFSGFWNLGFWKVLATPASVASMLGPGVSESDLFTDVDIYADWYAPYVYFGVSRGTIALPQPDTNGEIKFNPESPATRAHMAKWIVLGYELINDDIVEDPCGLIGCAADQYCDPILASCVDHAECVPTEEAPCEVGGGIDTVCGDNQCSGTENCETCADDCGECPPGCPDGVCNNGETCNTCPQDCEPCGDVCGDNQCTGVENCQTCPADCEDCPPGCPNNLCDNGETCGSCPQDCGVCPPMCGDNQCNGNEDCNSCSQDCGDCICVNNQIDQQACDPGTYCPPGTEERVCNNNSWGAWGTCESDLGLKFHGDGGKRCGPVICLQISGNGSDATLNATISKADNSAFANDVDLTIFQPASNLTHHYGCLPTQGQTSYNFQIYPDNFTISLGGTMSVNAQAFSPCFNGANYISGNAFVSQCSSN